MKDGGTLKQWRQVTNIGKKQKDKMVGSVGVFGGQVCPGESSGSRFAILNDMDSEKELDQRGRDTRAALREKINTIPGPPQEAILKSVAKKNGPKKVGFEVNKKMLGSVLGQNKQGPRRGEERQKGQERAAQLEGGFPSDGVRTEKDRFEHDKWECLNQFAKEHSNALAVNMEKGQRQITILRRDNISLVGEEAMETEKSGDTREEEASNSYPEFQLIGDGDAAVQENCSMVMETQENQADRPTELGV